MESQLLVRFALARQPCTCAKVPPEENKEWEAKNTRRKRLKRDTSNTEIASELTSKPFFLYLQYTLTH
jgi:hypothetical protein